MRAPASSADASSGHSTNAILPGPQVVGEQFGILACETCQAVEVQVRDGHVAPGVAVADAEGRAGDRIADPKSACSAANERGLARAELATNQHEVSVSQDVRQLGSEQFRLGGTAGFDAT